MEQHLTTIDFQESSGINRESEPVTFGMPFPRGLVRDLSELVLFDEDMHRHNFFCTPISLWSDGSIKWLLFDTQVSLDANNKKSLLLYSLQKEKANHNSNPYLKCEEQGGEIVVQTGDAEFNIKKIPFAPFSQVSINGKQCLENDKSQIVYQDMDENLWQPEVTEWSVETSNPFRLVLYFKGIFKKGANPHELEFFTRIHFYANKSNVRIDFTLSNPKAARHLGGVWDLGDIGSVLFKDLSLVFGMKDRESVSVSYMEAHNKPVIDDLRSISIYQDSSGGKNWYSHNHVNRENKIPLQFRGYKVVSHKEILSEGLRAQPFMAISDGERWIGASLRNFWENFPKSIEFSDSCLSLGLFPKQYNDFFELQGGEWKTHTIDFCMAENPVKPEMMIWTCTPLIPEISPEWYYDSNACSHPLPVTKYDADHLYQLYNEMINTAVMGKDSFVDQREIIDEYGWRNFGDLYADHEAVFNKDPQEFISHYNNQFDVIMGGLTQFFRTSDKNWFTLAKEHADHVSDIDIYHTELDRYQFNHGLFWHTDHHLDAATCTHRSVSQKHKGKKDPRLVGGGPSYDHSYATGFLYLYWLTGEQRYRERVLELAGNVIEGIKGPDTFCETFFLAAKKVFERLHYFFAKEKTDKVYGLRDGPGRASGNAVNVLLDAYLLSHEKFYLDQAEYQIISCISPEDNIEERNFWNVEIRWMYTVFLKALCRYMDIKAEEKQLDDMYIYVHKVLIKYAVWMFENEYPYLDKPEILEYPNESWASQELRKSDVLAYVACLVPGDLQDKMMKKSRFFFEAGINGLRNFENWTMTRPLVLMMRNGNEHLDIYLSWLHGDLCDWRLDDNPSSGDSMQCVNERSKFLTKLKDILVRTSPAKEWKWLWNQMEVRLRDGIN